MSFGDLFPGEERVNGSRFRTPTNWATVDESGREVAEPSRFQAAVERVIDFLPTAAESLLRAWFEKSDRTARTAARALLLNPNKGSDIVIERYVFTLNGWRPGEIDSQGRPKQESLLIGHRAEWLAEGAPQIVFRATELAINVNRSNSVFLNTLQVANIGALIGSGKTDASRYAAGGPIELPACPPQNHVRFTGVWTGKYPSNGYVEEPVGTEYVLDLSLSGPASIVV